MIWQILSIYLFRLLSFPTLLIFSYLQFRGANNLSSGLNVICSFPVDLLENFVSFSNYSVFHTISPCFSLTFIFCILSKPYSISFNLIFITHSLKLSGQVMASELLQSASDHNIDFSRRFNYISWFLTYVLSCGTMIGLKVGGGIVIKRRLFLIFYFLSLRFSLTIDHFHFQRRDYTVRQLFNSLYKFVSEGCLSDAILRIIFHFFTSLTICPMTTRIQVFISS